MMSRRQMLMLLMEEEEQGLPSEYLQVEYLQGIPRQQYIDTGVVAESISDFHLELKWRLSNSGSHVNYTPIFGDYIAEAYEATRMILTTTNDTSIYANCKSQAQGAKTLTNIALDTDHILSMEKGSATVDGTTTTLTTTKGTDNNNSIALCSNGVKEVVQTFASYSMRIYYFRVYSGSTAVRDMIPCIRVSDSKPGMYDLVGKQFYTNSGTGEFNAGVEGWDYFLFKKYSDTNRLAPVLIPITAGQTVTIAWSGNNSSSYIYKLWTLHDDATFDGVNRTSVGCGDIPSAIRYAGELTYTVATSGSVVVGGQNTSATGGSISAYTFPGDWIKVRITNPS